MSYEGFLPHCAICKQAVNLTENQADEHGQAVHEDCYVSIVVSKKVAARADYDHRSRIQTRQQIPLLVHFSEELSRDSPMPHLTHGGFWY